MQNSLNKKDALNVLKALACCQFGDLCSQCPWNNTKDCENTKFAKGLILSAITCLEDKNMKRIKIADIKIKESFAKSIPKNNKIKKCRNFWDTYHQQDRYIVINHEGVLIDGYIQYLVLKENGIEDAEIKISNRRKEKWCRKNMKTIIPAYRNKTTTYIYGIHPNSTNKKERVWRVPNSWTGWENDLLPGDKILVTTKHGLSSLIITRIEWLDKPPVDIPVRKVCKKLNNLTKEVA